jgi:hypothetical protein
MPIRFLRVLSLAAVIALSAAGFLRTADAASTLELAQSGNIMQCMEQCIRSEGKAEKATCKSRCANLSTRPAKPRDCMGTFKSCNKTCAKSDKACKKACKDALMTCS